MIILHTDDSDDSNEDGQEGGASSAATTNVTRVFFQSSSKQGAIPHASMNSIYTPVAVNPALVPAGQAELKRGLRVLCKDVENLWYHSQILQVRKQGWVLVQYEGWGPDFNEWVRTKSGRILPPLTQYVFFISLDQSISPAVSIQSLT